MRYIKYITGLDFSTNRRAMDVHFRKLEHRLFIEAMAGAFFETFVISEIIKSYYNKGVLESPLYFYRDKNMNEIDFLIENNGTLYPLEIKKHADPQKKDIFAAFDLLDKIPSIIRGAGGVICLYDNLITLKDNDRVIPVNYL